MRAILRERGEVSNRDFAMRDRTRVDHYRGRKDSALALHYLWRVGEVMVTRRERFERVYALAEAVAPPEALREVDPEEADDFLLRKQIAADGLSRLRQHARAAQATGPGRRAGRASRSLAGRRRRGRGPGRGLAGHAPRASGPTRRLIEVLERGEVPSAWAPIATTTDEEAVFLSPLDPVSARGRAKPLFGFDYVWEVYKPVEKRRFGYYVLPILWGDRLVGRFDPKLDRTTDTLVLNGLWLEDQALAKDEAFGEALAAGMERFVRLPRRPHARRRGRAPAGTPPAALPSSRCAAAEARQRDARICPPARPGAATAAAHPEVAAEDAPTG